MDVSRPHEGGESRSDYGMLPDYVTTNITLLSTGTGSAGVDRKEWTQAAQAVRPGDVTSQIALE